MGQQPGKPFVSVKYFGLDTAGSPSDLRIEAKNGWARTDFADFCFNSAFY